VDIGVPELLIILLVVLVIFGGAKLPQLARSLGHAQHEFKKGLSGHHDDDTDKATAKAADTPIEAAPERPETTAPDPTKFDARPDPSSN
jgi:sec-independent protein translocase protein TatA